MASPGRTSARCRGRQRDGSDPLGLLRRRRRRRLRRAAGLRGRPLPRRRLARHRLRRGRDQDPELDVVPGSGGRRPLVRGAGSWSLGGSTTQGRATMPPWCASGRAGSSTGPSEPVASRGSTCPAEPMPRMVWRSKRTGGLVRGRDVDRGVPPGSWWLVSASGDPADRRASVRAIDPKGRGLSGCGGWLNGHSKT